MIEFGSPHAPIRPSSTGKLLRCPMSVLLSLGLDSVGNKGAHTGNLFHAGIEAYHQGGALAGQEALDQSVEAFPLGDHAKASRWYQAYAADPANTDSVARFEKQWLIQRLQAAGVGQFGRADQQVEDQEKLHRYATGPDLVPAVELPVRLSRRGVFFAGTLDQVRTLIPEFDAGGLVVGWTPGYSVWDAKTGSFLDPEQTVDDYQAQQATYVLAAADTLGINVFSGGLIYASGYDKPRGRKLIPMRTTLRHCESLVDAAVEKVLEVRSGARRFTPSADGCKFCPHRRYPDCDRG